MCISIWWLVGMLGVGSIVVWLRVRLNHVCDQEG